MKACEPKEWEMSRWSKGIKKIKKEKKPVIDYTQIRPPKYKTYIDYIKESKYSEPYKQYCIHYYNKYLKQENIYSVIRD